MSFHDIYGLHRLSFDSGLGVVSYCSLDEMNQNPFCSRQRKDLRPDHGRIDDALGTFSPAAGTNATLRTLI
jgi:hypothetical protein